MRARRLKPLIWPTALFMVSFLVGALADLSVRSAETVGAYGMLRLAADLVRLIVVVWAAVALIGLWRRRRPSGR